MDKDDSRWGLALLIVVTLALRVAMICLEWGTFAGDQDSYGRLAVNWAMTGTFGFPIIDQPADQSATAVELSAATPMRATAYRPPMYPALLVPLVWNGQLNFEAVAALHVILGLITVLVVFFVADRLQMSAPWIPAMAVACDPILLRGSQLLMTETLITCLAVSVWAIYLILIRPKLSEVGREMFGMRLSIRLAFLMGALLGISVLTRPTMVPWALLAIVTLSLRSTSAGNRVSMITAAVLMLAAISITWMAR
ncbi:MAG: hypothetical protein IT423_02065, partial [Pirellulaceae bacterium]|nr:hypothetical protein [Pirellulaceae bacterium]